MHGEVTLDWFGIAWRLGLTLFFVALNGFFVAAEFALVKVRRARVDELARGGGRTAKRVQHILANLDLYLSSCQLGITLASLILGALGEPAVSVILIALARVAGVDVEGAAWLPYVSIGLAFAIITILHMTVGEQAPKMWALERSEKTALATAAPLRLFTIVFRPFILMVNGLSNWMLRVAGLNRGEHGDAVPTMEELRGILIESAGAGEITNKQLEITHNVFRLIEMEVRHIMVPRVDCQLLSLQAPLAETLTILRRTRHSRFPLCERDLDSCIGFVHGKDVLEQLIAGADIDLKAMAREPLFVPDTMALSTLLREMQVKRSPLALVLDEHGTVTGLVFREDALEEIVGPLGDEFDDEAPDFEEVEEGVWNVRGRMALPDLCIRLDVAPEDDEGEETAAGYLIARLGRMPKRGDTVRLGGFDLEATEIGRRRINMLRVTRRTTTDPDAEQD